MSPVKENTTVKRLRDIEADNCHKKRNSNRRFHQEPVAAGLQFTIVRPPPEIDRYRLTRDDINRLKPPGYQGSDLLFTIVLNKKLQKFWMQVCDCMFSRWHGNWFFDGDLPHQHTVHEDIDPWRITFNHNVPKSGKYGIFWADRIGLDRIHLSR